MVRFKISYKLMAGFLAIILLSFWISFYVQGIEGDARAEIALQAKIMSDTERMAKYNLELFSISQSYLLHDSELERSRAKSKFSESYGKLSGLIEILKKEGIDPYAMDMVEQYTESTKSNFEKITKINDAKYGLNDSAAIAETEQKEQMILKMSEDNEFKVIGARDMIVEAAKRNVDAAIKAADREERFFNFVMAGVFVFSILLGLYITLTVTRQISDLRDGVKKVGQGNLKVRLDESSYDELGEVAAAFNKMTDDLKKSTVSLKEMDEIVKKRTSETEAKNEELERFNKLSVGRELRMIELKKRIKELEEQLAKKKSSRQKMASS